MVWLTAALRFLCLGVSRPCTTRRDRRLTVVNSCRGEGEGVVTCTKERVKEEVEGGRSRDQHERIGEKR